MKYSIIITLAGVLAIAAFAINESYSADQTPCRGGWKYHLYGSWKSAGTSRHTFGSDHILMKRECLRCGHIDSKESN